MSKFTHAAAGPAEGFMAPRHQRALSHMGGCQVATIGLARETIYRRTGGLAQNR